MLADLLIHEKISELQLKAITDGDSTFTFDERFTDPGGFSGDLRIKPTQASPDGSNTLNKVLITVWRDNLGAQYSASTFITMVKRGRSN